ncbi:unnamed protein product [Polarella glacialis]|uniref:Endo-beta-1,6-galactanase-like domain-containing protein n=1 Tax=Polarella glacialis TaxID=89957 RepID=A0A813IKV4_POLGL|nr:unnamed protein product [Polarella glacialis]
MGRALGSAIETESWADLFFSTGKLDFKRLMRCESQTVPCLGLSIVRYNVGGVGYEKDREQVSSKCQHWFRKIEGFVPERPEASWKFEWSRDSEQRSFLFLARRRGVSIVELYFNAPMWWMTDSSSSFGGRLVEHERDSFAWYIAMVAKHFHDEWDVPVKSVSPFNEPSSGFWRWPHDQEGCLISIDEQIDIIRRLTDKLLGCQLKDKVLIAASEENFVEQALQSCDKLQKLQEDGLVGRCNMHSYSGLDPLREADHPGKRRALRNAVARDGLNIWMLEHGTGDLTGLGLAQTILEDLNFLNTTAWCYWQPVEHRSSWGLVEADFGDGPGEKSVQAIKPPSANYYILAHFSKYIRPGALMMDCSESWAVAFSSPHSLVLVFLNSSHSRTMKVCLPATFAILKVKEAVMTQPLGKQFFRDWTCTWQRQGYSFELSAEMENHSLCSVLLGR